MFYFIIAGHVALDIFVKKRTNVEQATIIHYFS